MGYLTYNVRYIKSKLFHVRMASFVAIMMVICIQFQQPLLSYIKSVNYPCSIWVFPFMMTRDIFATMFFLATLFVNADVPFMQNSNMYHLIRLGKTKWAFSNMMLILVRSFAMVLVTVFCSVLPIFPNVEWTMDWGKLITTLAYEGDRNTLDYNFFYEALQYFSPPVCMLLAILVLTLITAFIGYILYFLCLGISRTVAVSCCVGLILTTFFIQNIHMRYQISFSRFLPPIWAQMARVYSPKYGYYYLPSIPYMLSFLLIAIAILGALILIRIRKGDFQWENESY